MTKRLCLYIFGRFFFHCFKLCLLTYVFYREKRLSFSALNSGENIKHLTRHINTCLGRLISNLDILLTTHEYYKSHSKRDLTSITVKYFRLFIYTNLNNCKNNLHNPSATPLSQQRWPVENYLQFNCRIKRRLYINSFKCKTYPVL